MTAICTQFDTPFAEVAALTIPVMRDYCKRHGYRLAVAENAPIKRSIVWDRFSFIREALADSECVAHIDADVLITNLTIPLPQTQGICIAENFREDGSRWLNDGVCVFSNTGIVRAIVDSVIAHPDGDGVYCGQDVLQKLFQGPFESAFDIVPQNLLNSFLYTEYGMPETTEGHWRRGDFALHLPGRTNQRRVEIFKNAMADIIR